MRRPKPEAPGPQGGMLEPSELTCWRRGWKLADTEGGNHGLISLARGGDAFLSDAQGESLY